MNTALILSGGVGTRISSDIPKQYIRIGKHMMISHCIKAVLSCSLIDRIHITADEKWRDEILSDAEALIGDEFTEKFTGFSDPGKNRQLSIYNGLCDISRHTGKGSDTAYTSGADSAAAESDTADDIVIVHDAARPFVSAELLERCIDACAIHDGAMPALPMKDTVYLSEDGVSVTSLLERSKIYAGQAPEAFRLKKYLEATKALLPDDILKINGSTEPAIRAGLDIAIIPGDENNFKVTTDIDLKKCRNILG
ncbi:MAG: 2-C-methyl-D-erythritol 4-phosphate cytidylyltransferase [Lachnospiraceae bacterium]|nr:2-C-methyl-D-erythritol 4-phosphate cytidylyltransferase [Lachnospiraceae bacterium]